jgi:haloalkane dehalogenase
VTAYIVVHIEKTDAERFGDYEAGVIRTIKPYKGWVLGAGEAALLEGANDLKNHNVVIRFPSVKQAQDWWDSQEYRDIVPIRRESAKDGEVMLLAGLDMDVDVSGVERYAKKYTEILGKRMAYIDEGEGDPIVFLHGNPTSSYLWRNVMPYLEGKGRLIAPDLIGMGDSEKLDNVGEGSYRFFEHRKYLDALLEKLGVTENVTLVIHDWGSALGFDWANRNRDAVKGIAYMEAMVAPFPNWDTWVEPIRSLFQGFRTPKGPELVLEKNMFVEKVLTGAVMRKMGDAEMNAYRRPYLAPGESRRPTLTWPREIPVGGEPADMHKVMQEYAEWLGGSGVPKLFVNAEPGAILTGTQRELCRTWPNQTEVTVRGIHYIQEDSPDEIGQAIAEWMPS